MFYRFISENLTDYINRFERDAGNNDFDFSKQIDADMIVMRAEVISQKGFYIPPVKISLLAQDNRYALTKQRVLDKLRYFFERYFSLGES